MLCPFWVGVWSKLHIILPIFLSPHVGSSIGCTPTMQVNHHAASRRCVSTLESIEIPPKSRAKKNAHYDSTGG